MPAGLKRSLSSLLVVRSLSRASVRPPRHYLLWNDCCDCHVCGTCLFFCKELLASTLPTVFLSSDYTWGFIMGLHIVRQSSDHCADGSGNASDMGRSFRASQLARRACGSVFMATPRRGSQKSNTSFQLPLSRRDTHALAIVQSSRRLAFRLCRAQHRC